MKTRAILIGAVATASLGIAPVASADFEYSVDVADLPSGYVRVDQIQEYAGRAILAVGYRDIVLDIYTADATVNMGWGMTLPAYGTNFWSLAGAMSGFMPGLAYLDDVEHDVTIYDAEVAAVDSFFGAYNIGAGLFGNADSYVGVSGELYFVIEGDPIPAPGALALLGLGGIVARRRRR